MTTQIRYHGHTYTESIVHNSIQTLLKFIIPAHNIQYYWPTHQHIVYSDKLYRSASPVRRRSPRKRYVMNVYLYLCIRYYFIIQLCVIQDGTDNHIHRLHKPFPERIWGINVR
jgi:hypothetical protein